MSETIAHPHNPLVRFIYLRGFGFATGGLGVASSLLDHGAGAGTVATMFLCCLAWPWIARLRVMSAAHPLRTEHQNMVIDTGLAGFWVAVTGFDLLPTVMFVAVMGMDRMVVGGWRLFGHAAAMMAGMALAGWAAGGFAFNPHTSLHTMLWCLPFLVLYPLGLGWMAWLISGRVRRRKRELEQSSQVDAHTGLATRKRWEDELGSQLRRFRRYGTPATVMMVDIDHFKRINDSAGHLVGDEVLAEVARCIAASLREADTAGRYGGDEFGVVLPGVGREQARRMAEALRAAVAAQVRAAGNPVDLSIGLAEIGRGLDSVKAWIAAADAALYRAKLAGRGCVRD